MMAAVSPLTKAEVCHWVAGTHGDPGVKSLKAHRSMPMLVCDRLTWGPANLFRSYTKYPRRDSSIPQIPVSSSSANIYTQNAYYHIMV